LDLWRAKRSLYGADKLVTAMRKAGYDLTSFSGSSAAARSAVLPPWKMPASKLRPLWNSVQLGVIGGRASVASE
jgi:hypothetical protein